MAPAPAGQETAKPHTPRPVTRHFDFEDLEQLDVLEQLPPGKLPGGTGPEDGEEVGGCGSAVLDQSCTEPSESPFTAATSDESSGASTGTGGAEGPHSAGCSESSEPEPSTPRALEDRFQQSEAAAESDNAGGPVVAVLEGAPEQTAQTGEAASELRPPSSAADDSAGAVSEPRARQCRARRGRRWALRPSVGTWLGVLPTTDLAALGDGGDSDEEVAEGTQPESKDPSKAAAEKDAEERRALEEAPMVRRARWGTLTIDLHHFRRREQASDQAPELTRRPAPLDALPRWAERALAPMRERLKDAARSRLAAYDSSKNFPRPQDHKHGNRYAYEQHVLGEGLPQLREDLKRAYNHGCLGQVWRIVGGADKGGIIVREGSDLSSPQRDQRLATGSLVEHVSLNRDRLHYHLVSGSGPSTGWISTRYFGTDRKEKVMAVKVPIGEQADLDSQEDTGGQPSEVRQRPPVIVGLMAAHVRTEPRLKRFQHVLRSVRRQLLHRTEAEFIFAVSWSSPPEMADSVLAAIRGVAREPGYSEFCAGQEIYEVQQTKRHSQFQHLQAASHLAEDTLRARWGERADEGRAVWAIFGDDDDIWHHSRVAELANAIRSHPFIHGVGVFATTARMQCKHTKRFTDADMPVTEDQADDFLKQGRGMRLDEEQPCVEWYRKLRNDPAKAPTLPVPQELGLEYFDLCPRLRLVREYYAKTSPEFIAHRYCDLHFNEFLCTYTRKGAEMGLEVSFFFPRCWMLFYATPIPDERAVKKSVEHDASTSSAEGGGAGAGQIDVNNGHMSASYTVEPPEEELARRCFEEFRTYDGRITEARVARYWAAFRNAVEVYLVRYHRDKVDQRLFDCYIWFSICSSFFEFWDNCCKLSKAREKLAYDMLMYLGQGYARTVALTFECSILWLRPNIFLEPECAEEQPKGPAYTSGYGSLIQQMPYGYGGGAWWSGPASKNGKKPPWGHGPWPSKGPPFAKAKAVAKGGPPGVYHHPGMGPKPPFGGPVKHQMFGAKKPVPKKGFIVA